MNYMAEIRKDPISYKMVIIAKERAKRPIELKENKNVEICEESHNDKCFFCLGNEAATPPEVFRIEKDGKWQVRVFPNKFPILTDEGVLEVKNDFYESTLGQGHHKVVVETNRHNGSFFNMSEEEFENYFLTLKSIYNRLKENDKVEYISIFKNYHKTAGASLQHPHSQVITVPIVPSDIYTEFINAKNHFISKGEVLHEKIINYEREAKERVIHESENFIILAPFASIYNNEVEIIYKKDKRFEDINPSEIMELSRLMKRLFSNMHEVLGDFPFNMFIHTHPVDQSQTKYYRWHIHITPRLSCQAGFELSTGIYVNAVTPESVAEMLRW